MNTCSTCRHWQNDESAGYIARFDGYGICAAIREYWRFPPQLRSQRPMNDGKAAAAMFFDGYDEADLVTRSDFSCSLHSAKALDFPLLQPEQPHT